MKTKILQIINETGTFYYNPHIMWNDSIDAALKELREENKIETLYDVNIKFMNENFTFIKKGNPDNVRVITKGGDSYLTKEDNQCLVHN